MSRLGQHFYFCSLEAVLARLSAPIHSELVAKRLAAPVLADTSQYILEMSSRGSQPLPKSVIGYVYRFDSAGLLDSHPATEALVHTLKPRIEKTGSVIDITGAVAQRRWASQNTWKPSANHIAAVIEDIGGSSRCIPLWAENQCVRLRS